MGICGTSLVDNDVFMDVKACFADYMTDGKTVEEATTSVMLDYKEELDDDDDAGIVIMALADAQLEAGRLLMDTKNNV